MLFKIGNRRECLPINDSINNCRVFTVKSCLAFSLKLRTCGYLHTFRTKAASYGAVINISKIIGFCYDPAAMTESLFMIFES